MQAPHPQQTRWGPVDGLPAGISLNAADGDFISWQELECEIKIKILPQVKKLDELWADVRLVDHHGKKDWIVEIVDAKGHGVANIWFGSDPLKGWAYDGLVRVGAPEAPIEVWQVYQRYSDGSYRWQRL